MQLSMFPQLLQGFTRNFEVELTGKSKRVCYFLQIPKKETEISIFSQKHFDQLLFWVFLHDVASQFEIPDNSVKSALAKCKQILTIFWQSARSHVRKTANFHHFCAKIVLFCLKMHYLVKNNHFRSVLLRM